MSSDTSKTDLSALSLVTIFGGSGFVGRQIADALSPEWRIRIASRHPDPALCADKGFEFVQANITDPLSVAAALRDARAVINLSGILSPTPTQSFDEVHHQGARIIAEAAKKAGIERLIHLSAIGADQNSASAYARSKAAGEAAVLSLVPTAIIVRPSIVFGPEDDFFNRFGAMARLFPALPLIGGGKSLFQPVYVGDVAQMVALALRGAVKQGAIYELGGPQKYSFADLLRFICTSLGKWRLLLPLPFPAAMLMGAMIENIDRLLHGHFPRMLLITRDQVRLLRSDNIISSQAIAEGRTLQGVGLTPHGIEKIVPVYLDKKV